MRAETNRSPLGRIANEATKQFLRFKKFWDTKRAIARGDPLYDWEKSEINQKGYLEAWPFNILETVYASLPAMVTFQILSFLFGTPEPLQSITNIQPSLASPPTPTTEYLLFNEIYASTEQFFSSFLVPTITTTFVFLVGWACLKKEHSTSTARSRVRRMYLYFDGANGLFAQATLALLGPVILFHKQLPGIILWPIVLGGISGLLFELYIAWEKIPYKIFLLNGYCHPDTFFLPNEKPEDYPPTWKYNATLIISGLPLIIIVNSVLRLLSFTTAWILTSIKLLVVN